MGAPLSLSLHTTTTPIRNNSNELATDLLEPIAVPLDPSLLDLHVTTTTTTTTS
jgi:hypothetical protein